MTVQRLLFTSSDGSTLFTYDGVTVSQRADGASSPAFLTDPLYFATSETNVGATAYFTMADTTGATSAIWRYSGTALAQITASSNYVFNTADTNNPVAPQPIASYNGDLVFSQASLASNLAGDTNYDTATLAVYDPTSGVITQPETPNGGYDPHDFVTLAGTLYFEATDSTTTRNAIYSFDGTTVTEIYNLHPTFTFNIGFDETVDAGGSVVGSLIAFSGSLYFGSGQQSVYELTATTSLSNSASDEAGAARYNFSGSPGGGLIVSNSHLFFLSGNNGIYSLSTTNVLTQVVGSIGAQSFTPVVYNSALYFVSENSGGTQQNLYSSTGGAPSVVVANFSGSNLLVSGGTLYYNNNDTTLGTIITSTVGTLTVPGGAGGIPIGLIHNAAGVWAAASDPIAVTAGAIATYQNGGGAVTLDTGLSLTDTATSTLTSATVVIGAANFLTGDTLNFTDQNGIIGSYNTGTGVLTLEGTTSLANYQAAMDSITYRFNPSGGDATNGDTNPTRIISWAAGDGINNAIAATSTINTLCFCAGTLIATPTGETRVENLRADDLVMTAHNGTRPIRWIGTGRVLATRGKRGPSTPVIVRKNALADGIPHHDLRVTKGHALWLEDVLIPVEELINHRSILWDDHAQEVSLYHIELDTPDVLLANGVKAESYRDDGNRWLFQNANPGWHLPPQRPCAPVRTSGATVDAIWFRLLERSGPRAQTPLTDDPDLHLLVGEQRIDAAVRHGDLYIFRVPRHDGPVRIVSRDAVPEQLGLARDPRSLGVALRRIEISQGRRMIPLDAADLRLTEGFHQFEPEGNLRWTDGDALIPKAAFAGFDRIVGGTVGVALHIACTTRYPLFHEGPARFAA